MTNRLVLDLRPRGIPEVPMLGRYQYRHAKDGLAQHSHRDCLEICYLAKGRQQYRVGNRDYVLTGGDVFVTFPNEVHSTGGAPEEKGVLYWLILRVPQRRRSFLMHTGSPARTLAGRLLSMRHRHFHGDPTLQRHLDDIIGLTRSPSSPLTMLTINNHLIAFLLEVLECAQRTPTRRPSPAIAHVLRHVQEHLSEPVSVGALARVAGLSESRFKARFKSELGVPPSEYVLRRKIERAQAMLVRNDRTVTQVAFALGFSSSQYFATVFRRFTGLAPRAWPAREPS